MAKPTTCAHAAHVTPQPTPPPGARFEPLPLLAPSPSALAQTSDGLHAAWARLEDAARAFRDDEHEPARAQLRTAARSFVTHSDRCYRQWLAMEGERLPLDPAAQSFRAIHTHVERIERVDREIRKAWHKLEHWARRHAARSVGALTQGQRVRALRRAALVYVTWVDARAFLAARG